MHAICRHCGEFKRIQGRGLCSRDYNNQKIKDRYPKSKPGTSKQTGDMSRFKAKGVTNYKGRLPAEPTNALPGTAEKMEVMRQRVARGERPAHPKDARRALK